MQDLNAGRSRKALVLINYFSLFLLLFFHKYAVILGWNTTSAVLEIVLFATFVYTLLKVHIRTGLWKLVHTGSKKMDEPNIHLTRSALAFSLPVFTAFCLFIFYLKREIVFTNLSGWDYVALIYVADTLPSSFIAWGGRKAGLSRKLLIKWGKRVGIAIIVMIVFFILNLTLIRPWQHNWGATAEEINRDMPGDSLVTSPDMNATRVVTVNASPEEIWPWLVQLGYKRGGFYSYDYLDNAGVPSANRILPEFQNIAVGDSIPIGKGVYMRVRHLEPFESLVMQFGYGPWDGNTWEWGLYPRGPDHTRLVSRLRTKYIWEYPHLGPWLMIDTFEIIMMRKCLLGIKARAESHTEL